MITGSVCTPRFLSQAPIRKSHDPQPSQRQSVYEVPGRRSRHKALGRAGDLTARGPQRSREYRFQFGVGDWFRRRVEHLRMLRRMSVQNKNTKASDSDRSRLLELRGNDPSQNGLRRKRGLELSL